MTEQVKIFKARLDYYYKLLVIYFVFLIAYAMLRGTFIAKEFTIVLHDPILYITAFFVIYTFLAYLISIIKSKELHFYENRFEIKNRFGKREIFFKDIVYVKFSRERRKYKAGKSSVKRVRIKLLIKKKLLRIRLSEFNDEKKLYEEFHKLIKHS